MSKSTPHYFVDIFWSDEDGVFVARVPELAGVVTHGDTVAEAAKMAEEAIALHLRSLAKHNEAAPEPVAHKDLKGNYALRMGVERHRRAAVKAEQENLSFNEYVNKLIDQDVLEHKERLRRPKRLFRTDVEEDEEDLETTRVTLASLRHGKIPAGTVVGGRSKMMQYGPSKSAAKKQMKHFFHNGKIVRPQSTKKSAAKKG